MARRTLNRQALRAAAEAAESIEPQDEDLDVADEGDEDEDQPAKKKAKKPAKSRAKAAKKEVRLKAYWAVYNQAMKRVKTFEYSQRAEAEKEAEKLSASTKTPHFVQVHKESL